MALLEWFFIANCCWVVVVAVNFMISAAHSDDRSSTLRNLLVGLVLAIVVALPSYGVWWLRRSLVSTSSGGAALPSGWTDVKVVRTVPGLNAGLFAAVGLGVLIAAARGGVAVADLGRHSFELWFGVMLCMPIIWPLSSVGRVQFRLTDRGIVFPSRTAAEGTSLAWDHLVSVSRRDIEMRGIPFGHVWKFSSRDGEVFTVLYPAGALPWPGAVCREINRRARHVDPVR